MKDVTEWSYRFQVASEFNILLLPVDLFYAWDPDVEDFVHVYFCFAVFYLRGFSHSLRSTGCQKSIERCVIKVGGLFAYRFLIEVRVQYCINKTAVPKDVHPHSFHRLKASQFPTVSCATFGSQVNTSKSVGSINKSLLLTSLFEILVQLSCLLN